MSANGFSTEWEATKSTISDNECAIGKVMRAWFRCDSEDRVGGYQADSAGMSH